MAKKTGTKVYLEATLKVSRWVILPTTDLQAVERILDDEYYSRASGWDDPEDDERVENIRITSVKVVEYEDRPADGFD